MNWTLIYSFISRYFWRKIDNIILKGNQYITTPDLTVTNDASVGNDLTVTNDADVGNDLTVDNDISVGNNLTVAGTTKFSGFLKFRPVEKQISSGAITATCSMISLKAETGTTDDLDTINLPGGSYMVICLLCRYTHTITIKDGTGNINLDSGDVVLSSISDNLWLYKRTSTMNWVTFNSQRY